MDRMACVDLPFFPLQLLLRRQPEWNGQPVVVVDRDKPQGVILWVNDVARSHRILPGMRYAAGLSLARELRAGVVPEEEVTEALSFITRQLWRFSPRIEPAPDEAGIFWLDASGLLPLYPSLRIWASAIGRELAELGFRAGIAVGFTRFGSYAAARTSRRLTIFDSENEEQAHGRSVPLARLGIDPRLRDTLHKLGIDTVGGFLALPPSGVRRRFGDEAYHLHRRGRGAGWRGVEATELREPLARTALLDDPERDLERLLWNAEQLLESLVAWLERHREAVAQLSLHLLLDDGTSRRESLRPASPTLETPQLLQLIRLRLESVNLSAGVIEIQLEVTSVILVTRQLDLFEETPGKDLTAAHRALARLRAELGEDGVVHARLLDGHLPEARYQWTPLRRLEAPEIAPENSPRSSLVRRIYTTPVPLRARSSHEPDGWLIARFADGPVDEVVGPHVVNGGWWSGEIERRYHYVRTRSGRWLWIYHDPRRRRWFLQGEVE